MMGLVAVNRCCTIINHASKAHPLWPVSSYMGATFIGFHNAGKSHSAIKFGIMAFASKKSVKKLKREKQLRLAEEGNGVADRSSTEDDYVKGESKVSSGDNLASQTSVTLPSRSNVLQACTVTCGLITALGVIIRQVSHVAFMEGLPFVDCSMEVSFDFELWHLELITGLVVFVSSCRYLLLKTWPDFAESSEAANQQQEVVFVPNAVHAGYPIGRMLKSVLNSIDMLFSNAGTPLPRCTATTFWKRLEECLGGRKHIRCSTFG